MVQVMPNWVFILILLLAVVFIVMVISPRRRNGVTRNQRTCPQCGADNPGFAQYCRRCGKSF
jgi:predicted amidophosphoribosyltransferase